MSLILFDDTPYPAFDLNFMGGMPAGLTYTNSSTARAYWDSTGTRRSAVANEPIFETLNGVAMGMRWEMEARTNLATNSEGAAATWTVFNVSDAGTPIAGFSASLRFGDNSVLRYAYKDFTTVDATRYTVSVFVQMDDGGAPVVGALSTAGDFSLIIEGDIAQLDIKVQKIAGSLYRVSASRTAVAPILIYNGVVKYTTQSARTFRVIGIQLEAASSASSYIPTAGSAVIRQPDVLTATSISPWYRQDEGTVVFEGAQTDVTHSSGARALWQFDGGSNANRVLAYMTSAASPALVSRVDVSSVAQATMTSANTSTAGSTFKTATAYKVNDFGSSLNGGAVSTDASGSVPTTSTLGFGSAFGGTSPFMGYARRFQYYNRRLTNSQLQGLSRV